MILNERMLRKMQEKLLGIAKSFKRNVVIIGSKVEL